MCAGDHDYTVCVCVCVRVYCVVIMHYTGGSISLSEDLLTATFTAYAGVG